MDRLIQGSQLMKEVFGVETAEQVHNHLEAISPPFLDFLKSTFSDIYSDQTLDLTTKEIIVLTTLITQKDAKPQLKTHIKAAIRAGLTPKEIYALILQLVLYVGFPTAINALNTAKETFDEMAIKP
ncbi:MAG: carboxymuconolactone decarboxylase family protein [Gammaproteobacteria bacterium]|nr:carboxymuconolactone decarboxylase family protein [Gammaproteobacteria bacterium]